MNELSMIDVDNFDGSHKFLAEELLIPNVDKCDLSRVNMFTSHIAQTVILKDPQFPKVFTNFENQVGKYSSSFKVSDGKRKIVKVLQKNEMNKVYLVEDENGALDVIHRKPCERITEDYGYKVINEIDSKEEGDTIEEGELLYRSTSYDENLNFMYGSNLKAIYLAYNNLTYEDAIVISESAAKKLSSYKVDVVTANINTNDFLINLYGDHDHYKTFPDIGETVKNRIVMARRRINYDSILFDASVKNMSRINYDTDQAFYTDNGTVVDIDIFSNADLQNLEDRPYYDQITKYIVNDMGYYTELVEAIEPYIDTRKYTDEVGYIYKRAHDILDEEVKWRNNKNNFDNIVVRFYILKEQKLDVGSKLTNRYGGKGCISAILPDDQMPMTEDGERAEIVLNPLGVMNRLNPAQLYEQEINFISNEIIKRLKVMFEEENYDEMTDLFFEYIHDVNSTQHDSMVDFYNELDDDGINKFWDDIFTKGIFIHQPPFYGNIKFDGLKHLYNKYDIKPLKFKGIENPLIMGDMYIIVLKHHPSTKFSARSSSYLNLKNIPSKSNSFKEHLQLYSMTPIKIGEMEVTNLFISNNIKEVVRLLSMYSTNEEDRQNLITALSTKNIFNLEEVEKSNTPSHTGQILNVYLKSVALELSGEDD